MRILAVIAVVFYLYLPFASNNFNSVDDIKTVNTLLNIRHIDYYHLFFPPHNPYYYRPLLGLSFIFDQKAHLCSAYFMHLENLIIHLLNTIIIIVIARCILTSKSWWPAYLASVIFAIHPVNTEAVNWISARTDLLAGFFTFLAFFLLIKSNTSINLLLSGASFLAGLLCKESAIGFLPFAFIWVLYFYRDRIPCRQKAVFVFIFSIAVISYFMMRYPELRFWNHPAASKIHLSEIILSQKNAPQTSRLYELGVFFKVIGFYFKKLFIPWPLNFAITKINGGFYLCLGILVMGVIILFAIWERGIFALSLTWSLCFMLITVLVPLRRMAWTPLAERYVYISSFGMSLFLVHLIQKMRQYYPIRRIVYAGLCIYMLVFYISSAYRNYTWKDNYRLYMDTVKKSPDFGPAHNELAITLLDKGKKEEAKREFEIAARLTRGYPLNPLARNNVLLVEQNRLKPEEVLDEYDKLIGSAKGMKVKAEIIHNALRYINSLLLNNRVKKGQERLFYMKKMQYFKKLSMLEDPAFCYYKIGQLCLVLKQKDEALIYFKKAYRLASKDRFFKNAALNLIHKLENRQ